MKLTFRAFGNNEDEWDGRRLPTLPAL